MPDDRTRDGDPAGEDLPLRGATSASVVPPGSTLPTEQWRPGEESQQQQQRPPARWPLVLVLALMATAVAVLVLRPWRHHSRDDGVILEPPVLLRFTAEPGFQEQPALSPDGAQLVYSDGTDLFLRRVEGGKVLNLTGESAEAISITPGTLPEIPMLALSPDDRTLYLAIDHSDADLWIADFTALP